MKITQEDWTASEERLAEVIAWAKANNLVPENIVAEKGLVIENGEIHWHEFVREGKGRTQVAPGGDEVLSMARVSPLLTPYPQRKMGG